MRTGHTLMEVLIAMFVLEVSLLGATGMLVLASASLRRAGLVEQAAAEAALVADSLSRMAEDERTTGSLVRGPWRVRWEPESGMTRIRADLVDGGSALVELRVP